MGVGAGVAVNSVDITNRASTGSATTNSVGLDVEATMRNVSGNTQHLIKADAFAGASKASDVGVAGALALNIVVNHTEAVVANGANATSTGGALTLNAVSDEKDVANASGKEEGGGSSVGVGAAVSINVLTPSVVRAEAEDSAGLTLTSGSTVSVTAIGTRVVETTVEAGSKGSTSISPAVALVIDKDDAVTARLGTSGTSLSASGAATISATHTGDLSKTTAKAEAAGSSVSVGADISLNIVLNWTTTAEVARDLTASAVTIGATSTMNSAARSDASAKGNDSSDSDADSKSQQQVDNNPNTTGKAGTLPKANDSTSQANGQTSGQTGGNSGNVGIAAAIAVNWTVTTNSASIGAGAHVTGTSGLVKVSATNDSDAAAKATGIAFDMSGSTEIGAAVGLNVEDMTNTASVGQDAVVQGAGVTVEAIIPAGHENDFTIWGFAAAGGKSSTSIAGSAAIQVLSFDTEASIGAGAHVTSSAGIGVNATNKIGLQNLAIAAAGNFSGSSPAVGGAVAVTVMPDVTTKAFVDSDDSSHITHLDALGGIAVTATSSLEKTAINAGIGFLDGILPSITSVAVGGGASGGGAAVTGSILVEILTITTTASIAGGTEINKHPDGAWAAPTSAQTLDVTATDTTHMLDIAGTLSLTAGGVGFGAGIIVDVITKHVHATVGDVNGSAKGNVNVTATSTEDLFYAAVQAAGSTSDAAFVGSFIVIVVNEGTDDVDHAVAAASVAGTLHSGADMTIEATDTFTLVELAGGLAISASSAGIAIALAVLDRHGRVDAGIGQNASIEAKGSTGLKLHATQTENLKLISIGGGGGDSVGIAGSIVVDVLNNHTKAHVDKGATINSNNSGALAGQSIEIRAKNETTVLGIAGALAIGGSAGVGVGVDVEVMNKDTEASIGQKVTAKALGDAKIDAMSKEDLLSIAVGGTVGGTVAVSVNAGVSVINPTTLAFVDGGSAIDASTVRIGGTARVNAADTTKLNLIAGNISASGSAAIGGAAAIPIVTKTTQAYINDYSEVSADGGGSGLDVSTGTFDVTTVDTRFTGGAVEGGTGETLDLGYKHGFSEGQQVVYDNGGGTSIGGLANTEDYFVHVVSDHEVKLADSYCKAVGSASDPTNCQTFTAQSFITLNGGVATGESHRLVPTNSAGVRSDTKSQYFNPKNGSDVTGNTINLPYSIGASTDDQLIYSSGGGKPIGGLEDGGTYYAIHVGGDSYKLAHEKGGSEITLDASQASGRAHSLVKNGNLPSGDASETTGIHTISEPNKSSGFKGVAVTATNSDDILGVGVSAAVSGGASVGVTGNVNIVHADTSATIGKHAKINTTGSPAAGQSVLVASGNVFHALMVTVSIAGGTVGVGAGVTVGVVTLNSDSLIDESAEVHAAKDVVVMANGKNTIVSFTIAGGGGVVGVAGAVSVIVLKVHDNAGTGSSVTIVAGNNVIFNARDETKTIVVAGGLSGGFVGVGMGVGVTSIDKDTRAYIGQLSSVDAKAEGAAWMPGDYGIDSISNGNINGKKFGELGSFHGLAVQATSSEDMFGLAIAVGGGFVGVAGGIGVTLITATTYAYIDADASINTASTSSGNQSVNVNARDFTHTLTIGGGAAGGFVGVAGGIDVGVAQTTTKAAIGSHAIVKAKADIDVYALAIRDINTYAVSIGAGFVGAAGSVSVWTVGTTTNRSYNDADSGPDRGAWSLATATNADPNVHYHKGDVVTASNGKRYGAKIDDPTQDPASPGQTEWQGPTDSLHTSGGDADTTADTQASGGGGGYQRILDQPHDTGVGSANSDISDQIGSGGTGDGVGKKIQDSAPSGKTHSALASGPMEGTVAFVDGTLDAGGAVNVIARDNLTFFGIAGSIAAGVAAIGGGVLVANMRSHADASIALNGDITAGGAVNVIASSTENSMGIAFAGQVGLVTIGAQVVVINDSSDQIAHIDTGAKVKKATIVDVEASANRSVRPWAIGVAVSGIAVGAAVAVANVSGDTSATIGNVAVGGGGTVGAVKANADSHDVKLEIHVISVGVGLAAIGGAIAFGSLTGTTHAGVAPRGPVAGNVEAIANGTNTITADTLNASFGGAAIGLTIANVKNGRSTTASLDPNGSGVDADGFVHVSANSANHASVETPGAKAGLFTLDVLLPSATVSGATTATLNGKVIGATDAKATAISDNEAVATAKVYSVSVVGLSGVVGDATITGEADTEASVGSSGDITSDTLVRIEAKTADGKKAYAHVDLLSRAGGVVSGGALIATATQGGDVRARIDGKIHATTTVDILATSESHRRPAARLQHHAARVVRQRPHRGQLRRRDHECDDGRAPRGCDEHGERDVRGPDRRHHLGAGWGGRGLDHGRRGLERDSRPELERQQRQRQADRESDVDEPRDGDLVRHGRRLRRHQDHPSELA